MTMLRKHSPAPWMMSDPNRDEQAIGVTCSDEAQLVVADVYHDVLPKDVALANARLIAAAPDLLVALKFLTAEVSGLFGIAGEEIRAVVGNTNVACVLRRRDEAAAAIAKAEVA
jgi:hypothetical protein